jgi:hypothetical protein
VTKKGNDSASTGWLSQLVQPLLEIAKNLPLSKLSSSQVVAVTFGVAAVILCITYFIVTSNAQLGLVALFAILGFFAYLHRATQSPARVASRDVPPSAVSQESAAPDRQDAFKQDVDKAIDGPHI